MSLLDKGSWMRAAGRVSTWWVVVVLLLLAAFRIYGPQHHARDVLEENYRLMKANGDLEVKVHELIKERDALQAKLGCQCGCGKRDCKCAQCRTDKPDPNDPWCKTHFGVQPDPKRKPTGALEVVPVPPGG